MPSKYKPRSPIEHRCLYCGDVFFGRPQAVFCPRPKMCREKAWRRGLLATKKTAASTSLRLRFTILERDGFRCTYCGRGTKDGATLVIDHVVPLAKGGTWEFDNLTTACEECNGGKADKILEFRS